MLSDQWLYCRAAVGSLIAWTNLYILLRIFSGSLRPHEFTNRQITAIHGLTVSAASAAVTVSDGLCLSPLAQPSSPLHDSIIVVSLGYFLFDLLWIVGTKAEESRVMFAHHVISIIAFLYILQQGLYGCEAVAAVALSELTNPLLQLRWFLKYFGVYRGILAITVDWIFALSFWFLRMVVGTILLVRFLQNPEADMFAKVCGVFFYAVSAIFSVQIAQYLLHQYRKRRAS